MANTDPSAAPPDPFDLTEMSLQPSTLGLLYVQYAHTNPYWVSQPGVVGAANANVLLHLQHEVLLFARDPAELAATSRAIPIAAPICTISHFCGNTSVPCGSVGSNADCQDINTQAAEVLADWTFTWQHAMTPDAAQMLYPPRVDWDVSTPAPVVATLDPTEFWTNGAPFGPGAAPTGQGSVKAAKIINHGACSVFQAYQADDGTGLLQKIANALPAFALHAVAADAGGNDLTCDDIEKRWLTMSPFLDFTQDKEDAQVGGFFLDTNIQINDAVLGGGPNMVLRDASRWRLFNGRLTVQGEVLAVAGSGTGADTFKIAFNDALTREMDAPLPPNASPKNVAEAIYSIADGSQAIPSHFTCGQRAPGDSTVLANDSDPNALCQAFVKTGLENGFDSASAGVGAVTLGLTSAELAQARQTMLATELVNGQTVWKNIRCSTLVGDEITTCNYALPAKRVNAYPDGVELVFLDDLKELDNPVYPIWLIQLEHEFEGKATTLAPLCDDPIDQQPGHLGARSFSALTPFDYVQYKCIGNGTNGCDCGTIGSFNNGKSSCVDTKGICTVNLDCCSGHCQDNACQ